MLLLWPAIGSILPTRTVGYSPTGIQFQFIAIFPRVASRGAPYFPTRTPHDIFFLSRVLIYSSRDSSPACDPAPAVFSRGPEGPVVLH